MKGIDFIDALSQIDPALADSYLNGAPAAEQETAFTSSSGITVQKTSQSAAEHPRRLKLLSTVGVLGSMAACAALVFGFWKLAAPEPASTEQSSEVSVISLEADSKDDAAAAVTTAVIAEKPAVTAAEKPTVTAAANQTVTAAASGEKAAAKTTAAPAQTAAGAAKTSASDQKPQQTVTTQTAQQNEIVTTPVFTGKTSGTQQGLTYEVQNGEVTITGFTDDLPEVLVIPAEIGGRPVTRIGAYAFNDAQIKTVTIPEGVRELGNNAFCFCESLETVSLPESIEKIGSNAFSMTIWLKQHPYSNDGKFIIEKNILLLADVCACEGDVIIPDGIKYIAGGAFFTCDAMTSVVIPDSVTSLGDDAFDGCQHLRSVNIPANLTEIGKYAFTDCRELTSVSLPETLCSIGDGAFSYCVQLKTVTFAAGTDGLTEIPFNAFRSCIALKSARLPDSVTSIGDFAFFGCGELTDFALPPALTHLGESALNDCYALESLTIPEGLTYIPECAFTFCENVTEITVPAGVTAVDAQAFWLCKKLEKITFLNPDCTIYDAADTISTEREGGFAGVIIGYEGSEAQAYAAKYGCTFESLGAAPHR